MVKATAFNSTVAQTDHRPTETACGERLVANSKVVAVSRDLEEEGLTCGARIHIEGLEGSWTVVDRTAARHSKLIDIYMGKDLQAAREWGVQEVEIRWHE